MRVARLRLLLYEEPDDPALNLALDEALAMSASCRGWIGLRLWRNRSAVVLGYSTPISAVNLEEAERLGASILRRVSGGGAVYHDMGNVNYSLYLPVRRNPVETVEEAADRVVAAALRLLGIRPRIANGSDVVVDGFKVSGNAGAARWGATLVHGTLLLETEPEIIAKVTPPPEAIPPGIDPVKYRASSLKRLGYSVSLDEAVEALIAAVEEYTGLKAKPSLPSREELEAAYLLRTRHLDREWVMGRRRLSSYRDLMERARRLVCRS